MTAVHLPRRLPDVPEWTLGWTADPPGRASLVFDQGRTTVLVATDGRRLRSVPERRGESGGDPGQLSMDGSRLAFTREEPASHIAVLDLAAGSRRDFRIGVRGAEVLAWLPSGRRLIYGTEEDVFLLDPTGRSVVLDLGVNGIREVVVSPEGDRIAVDAGGEIRIGPLAGGPVAVFGMEPDEWLCEHSWSPDGRHLVVSAEGKPAGNGLFTLTLSLLNVDTGWSAGPVVTLDGLLDHWFLGWRTYDSFVLLERRDRNTADLVVRDLTGAARDVLMTVEGPVSEVHAAAELLPVAVAAPDDDAAGPNGGLDVGPTPRWTRMTGGRLKARGRHER